ncbi:RB1-inducible coiled-coil protein 1-like [Watersipora subatra]|uniref:RB1-inducible coiled-coil protein 1-like n=1 Tax=Watersipora subatra TaxID=2589382 RepID=UPI00355B0ECF
MNIHVFYVNKGDMLTYDLSLAMGSVSQLQRAIERDLSIPMERQVMLVSGGEAMSPASRVSSYSAGTDTCPIFLFNLKAIEEKNAPEILPRLEHDNVQQRIEGSINMAPTLATLSTRTQLALDLRDLSQQHMNRCRGLVHEQHLQHQGWCSVVANLEDSLQVFTEEANVFISWYKQFLECKSERQEMLQNFAESYELLSKMPILPSLREVLNKPNRAGVPPETPADAPDTLLAFFIKLEDNPRLVEEAEQLLLELSKLDEELLRQTMEEKEKVLESAAMPSMKEVRGLENRLSSLEQLILKVNGLVKEQEEYAQGFVNNQKRCRELADPHVLPDLSISHKATLRTMEKNFTKLVNHMEQCLCTKRELCTNLHGRLRWTMYVEKIMSSLDGRIALQFENLKRLKYRLDKLDQVARAPAVYAQLCAEVCRRKSFSFTYNKWNHKVYNKANDWYRKEVEHRKKFYQSIGKHFLKAFFSGLDKVPPQVMVLPPSNIDDDLPSITEQEIALLKQILPELEPWLMVHDEDHESEIVSLVSTLSPNTPSDIVLLSARHSSHGSLAKAFSPEFDTQIISTHTAPSTMESISGNSNSAGDGIIRYETIVDEAGQLQPEIHMMEKIELFEDVEEDASAATDDDAAPGSLMDSSAAFTTANFCMNFDESEKLAALTATIAMQNAEIQQLLSENSLLKEKCKKLKGFMRQMGSSASEGVRQLKEAYHSIASDLSSNTSEFSTLHARILSAVGSVSTLHKYELDTQLQAQLLEQKTELVRFALDRDEHEDLKDDFKKLQKDYDSLLQEMESQEARQRAELEVAMKDIDSVGVQTNNLDESGEDTELVSLRDEVEYLIRKVSENESVAKQDLENLKSSMSLAHELRIKELQSEHKKELKVLEKSRQRWKAEVFDALELEGEVEHTQGTEELASAAEDNFAADLVLRLQEQIKRVKEKALNESINLIEERYQQQLTEQEKRFVERTMSQEQEFEYRSTKMKESLQLAHEMKYEEKLEQLKKEKDSVIRQLHKKLNKIEMSESVVCVDAASTNRNEETVAHLDALQEQLKEKESFIKGLQHKLNSYEMSASLRTASLEDKVSVKSCAAGDKVILCYDERYRHYLIFSLEAINYFVHTDSLEGLGLDDSVQGDQRKSWLLAEVVSKVLCQAKKENNRFRVPVNTKFYRVKVKPWSL